MSDEATFNFPEVDSLIPVAVGEPGDRTFHIQAVSDNIVVSLKMEKQQVQQLAENLQRVIENYEIDETPEHVDSGVHTPILAEWVAGAIGMARTEEPARVIVIVEQLFDHEANPDKGPDNTAQFGVSASQARAFIAATNELLASGRPLCDLCGMPMDPTGHLCPRLN